MSALGGIRSRMALAFAVIAAGALVAASLAHASTQEPRASAADIRHVWTFPHAIPPSVALRPTWLPGALSPPQSVSANVFIAGSPNRAAQPQNVEYDIAYCEARCFSTVPQQVQFTLNSTPGRRQADVAFPLRIRGITGTFAIYRTAAQYGILWHVGSYHYAVFGTGISVPVLRHIVEAMQPETRFHPN